MLAVMGAEHGNYAMAAPKVLGELAGVAQGKVAGGNAAAVSALVRNGGVVPPVRQFNPRTADLMQRLANVFGGRLGGIFPSSPHSPTQ